MGGVIEKIDRESTKLKADKLIDEEYGEKEKRKK